MSTSTTNFLCLGLFGAALGLPGCTKAENAASVPPASPVAEADASASDVDGAAILASVLDGAHRKSESKSRDPHRHPQETLEFFGVQPDHHVVELWAGGGWYTEILGPYLHQGGGALTVTLYDKDGPEAYYGTRQAKRMLDRFEAERETLGPVGHVVVPLAITMKEDKVDSVEVKPFSLGEPGTADVVLTFRNSHGWLRSGAAPLVYGAAFEALKPGGVFGVVQHRAAEGTDPAETSKAGYVSEAAIIEAVVAAGFVLDARSELNANPRDTKDYAGGVWTLPPSLSQGEAERDKYLEIGESDRMTLRFVKPKA